jgi:hypothetical protein
MIVKWYQIFSVWVFLASILYGLKISPINTFSLNIVSVLPGIYQLAHRYLIDPWWKLLYVILLHGLPFLWMPIDLSIKTIMNNGIIAAGYYLFMEMTETSVLNVYKTMLHEKPTSFTTFLERRFL